MEEDSFRLVIRGTSLIEEVLKDALGAAFSDGTPRELEYLPLKVRVAFAGALELITPEIGSAVKTLGQIRNRLAHGSEAQITDADVRALVRAVEPIWDDELPMDAYPEDDYLRLAIATTWLAVSETIQVRTPEAR